MGLHNHPRRWQRPNAAKPNPFAASQATAEAFRRQGAQAERNLIADWLESQGQLVLAESLKQGKHLP